MNQDINKVEELTKETFKKIDEMQKNSNAPTLESLEEMLKKLSDTVPVLLRNTSIVKSLIKMLHQQASMIDKDQEEITNLFRKYGVIAPVFEKED